MFGYGDGCTMSAKKDGMANIGGFLCTNDDLLAQQQKDLLILTEGYPTYGGLAGRDLEAVAVGVQEALEEDYLRYRIASTAYLGNHISEQGVPIVQPPGGHAIYLDAREFLPHIPPDQFPGVALATELYLEGGIRSVEIGALMFGAAAKMDLVRLAIPRRSAPDRVETRIVRRDLHHVTVDLHTAKDARERLVQHALVALFARKDGAAAHARAAPA